MTVTQQQRYATFGCRKAVERAQDCLIWALVKRSEERLSSACSRATTLRAESIKVESRDYTSDERKKAYSAFKGVVLISDVLWLLAVLVACPPDPKKAGGAWSAL
jgi:hypothetical protein